MKWRSAISRRPSGTRVCSAMRWSRSTGPGRHAPIPAIASARSRGRSRRIGETIDAYTKEYELGQRSLIDLLNAQNTLFSASVSLVSVQSLAIFADFQMLAAMGHLLAYLNEAHSIDAEPLTLPFGFVPLKLAPVRILDPDIKSELLPVKQTIVEPSLAPSEHPTPVSPKVRFGRPEDALFQAPYWAVNFSWMSARAYMREADAKAQMTDADAPATSSERMNFTAPDNRPSWLPKQIAGK